MLDLDGLETKSVGPVSVELWHLLWLVESWHCELVSPEWSKAVSGLLSAWNPEVLDSFLIVEGSWEGPDIVFVKSVINGDSVWLWWIGVKRLSLNVPELKLLIVILSRDDWGHSNNVLL